MISSKNLKADLLFLSRHFFVIFSFDYWFIVYTWRKHFKISTDVYPHLMPIAIELGGTYSAWSAGEGVGEVLGERGGYGSGFVWMC